MTLAGHKFTRVYNLFALSSEVMTMLVGSQTSPDNKFTMAGIGSVMADNGFTKADSGFTLADIEFTKAGTEIT